MSQTQDPKSDIRDLITFNTDGMTPLTILSNDSRTRQTNIQQPLKTYCHQLQGYNCIVATENSNKIDANFRNFSFYKPRYWLCSNTECEYAQRHRVGDCEVCKRG